jgi:8-oxo-dGTP pyrophosphatase MutT (NUDIX family)
MVGLLRGKRFRILIEYYCNNNSWLLKLHIFWIYLWDYRHKIDVITLGENANKLLINMTNNYRQISRGIILHGGKVLLARATDRVNYFLPGGGIKEFESAKDALTREIKEELGVASEIIEFLGIIENKWSLEKELIYETNYLFSLKLCNSTKSNPTSKENGLKFEWKSLREIETLTIYPTCVGNLIKNIVNKSSFEIIWISNF